MDKQIKRYYKQAQFGGRSTAARAVDAVVIRLIFALACYLWFRHNIDDTFFALLLTGLTSVLFLLALHIWRNLSFEKFIKKEQARLEDVILRERLLLLPGKEFLSLCHALAKRRQQEDNTLLWCSQRFAPLDEDAVLTAYHAALKQEYEALLICTLSPCTAKAAGLIKRLPLPVSCITPDQLLPIAREWQGCMVTKEDVEAYILQQQSLHSARRARVQKQPFAPENAKKYALCAVALFLASFVTGYKLYYRLLAGLCLLLAAAAVFVSRQPVARSDG